MNNTPASPALLGHEDLSTCEQRIAAWCQWFDLPEPDLRYEDGGILMTDQFHQWIKGSCANLDWLFRGDPQDMALAYYRETRKRNEFAEVVKGLSNAQLNVMAEAMRAHDQDGLPFEDAMAQMQSDMQKLAAAE